MSKLRQRQRQQRLRTARPRRAWVPPAPAPAAALGGLTPQEALTGGTALAQDLHTAAGTARARADGGYDPASVLGHFLAPLRHVYQVMEAVSAAGQLVAPPHLTPACTPGCAACCRLYVEVGVWEAFAIAAFLPTAAAADALDPARVRTRLQEEVAFFVASGSKDARRVCAFLTPQGGCGVYPARPAACRSYYSVSRAACERYFAQAILDEEVRGPRVLRLPDQAINVQLVIAEARAAAQPPLPAGEGAPFYEMQSAVLRILETPNALVRYLHGEDIFAGCARHTPETELRAASQQLVQLQVPPKGAQP
jgi:hypothetical protein